MKELNLPGNPLSNTQMITFFSGGFSSSKRWMRIRRALTRVVNSTGSEEPNLEESVYADKIAVFFIVNDAVVVGFYQIHKNIEVAPGTIKSLIKEAVPQKQDGTVMESPDAGSSGGNNINIYQKAVEEKLSKMKNLPLKIELKEIGPRFTLIPRETDLE